MTKHTSIVGRSSRKVGSIGIVVESRIKDLERKGVLVSSFPMFNPEDMFDGIVFLTPYKDDLELAQTLGDEGAAVVCHGGRIRRPWTLPLAVFRIALAVRRYDIRLLRGSNVFLGSLLAVAAARLSGIKAVGWMGGDNRIAQGAIGKWYYRSRRLTNTVEWLALRSLDRVIVPNAFTRRYVANIVGERRCDHVVVVPWSPKPVTESGPALPSLRERYGIPKDAPIIAVIGFLNRYKYTDVLFSMLESGPIAGSGTEPPATLVFCGDGELSSEGHRLFQDRPDVIMTGFQNRDFVGELLRESAVVCVPMSGMVLLEAASLGKPVVAGDVEWHSEIIRHGETGLLSDPTDPEKWRAALSEMIQSTDQAECMGAALKRLYQTSYSFPSTSKRLRALLDSLRKKDREEL